MKTEFTFSHLLFAIGILFVVGGCQRDSLVSPLELEKQENNVAPDEISIERAKQLYEASENLERKNARKRTKIEAPDWERAKKLRFKKGEKALVIPVFEMPETATFMTIGSVEDPLKLTLMDLITPVQLVIYKDKKGKEVLERMYSKSDREYRIRKNNKTEDRDFTGMRWFEDEIGNFKRGFVYENGEVVKRLYPNTDNTSGARTMCQTYTITVYMAWYSTLCGPYGCYDPIYMHTDIHTYSYQDCDQKHPGSESYGFDGETGGAPWGGSSGNQGAESSVGEGWGVPEDRLFQFLNWVANLNQAESNWIKANPKKAPGAWWNFVQAENISRGKYMCQYNNEWVMDADGTNQNAFKHAYWSARNQRSFGSEVAQTIGENHEGDVTSTNLDVQMDLFNNQLGRKVAETCGCDGTELQQAVSQAIGTGLGKRRRLGISSASQNYLFNTSSASTLCDGN